jgi:glycosyltransferase involved in cell wall biosynthesis
MFKKPVFHIIHNSYLYPEIVDAEYKNYIVYNSQWIKDKLNYKHPSYILPPPVDYRHYDVGGVPDHNTYYTLINVNENKGGHILVEIAKAMPHKQFLGVIGSYDEQITQKLPNLTYIEKTTDIREVMKKTRVLLMPSEYESWGRTATEAMSSGIPVICTDTPGLVENCGKAGIYIKDRNDIENWVQEIKKLDDAKAYLAASKKAKARSREHDPREALDGFEKWVREMANK